MEFRISYGETGRFRCELEPQRVRACCAGPAAAPDLAEEIAQALAHPIDSPPLEQFCVPGDRVVLALDRHTPASAELVAAMWPALEFRGVVAEDVQIVQPAGWDRVAIADPRAALPSDVRDAVRWTIHDPTDQAALAYLASTARGERIYLARPIVEADVVFSIGPMEYDSVLGYRGTSSVFYPGLSDVPSIARARGQGHSELGPDDQRPLRELVDEVAWLLGTQFTLQVIPAARGAVATVLAGMAESVLAQGKKLLAEHWHVRLPERADVVLVTIDATAATMGWNQLGAALATARNLVTRGGAIVVLSEFSAELDAGMELLRESRAAKDALQPIRRISPPDMVPALQLAMTADWARIYFLSRLNGDVVEELFMTPLDTPREVERLLAGGESCVILNSAQHAFGEIQTPTRSLSRDE
jgi:nickel-dependent lactate racemase